MSKDEQKTKKKGGCLKTALIVLLVIVVGGAAVIYGWFKLHEDEINSQMLEDTLTGQAMPAFEVTTTDGDDVTMNGLLENKEVLVVVLFATWCGPCEKEFPEMDEVYQKYKDKVSMIALDFDSLDDEKGVKEYAESHDLSFPIAMGNESLDYVTTSAYPTTLIVDRNGMIGCRRVGGITNAAAFENMITAFMGDEYTERQLGYYTFMAYAGKQYVPGVEFTVTSSEGTETYTTDETGRCELFTEKPEDMTVKVTKVPDGYKIDGTGELQTGTASTVITLPVK